METTSNGKKGLARIAELEAKYPDFPRSAIIKADSFREGIGWTPDLTVIGRWSIPHTHMIFDWDHDHLDDKVEASEGWMLIPAIFQLRDGTSTILKIAAESPYEIKILEGDTRYMLYRDGEAVEEVYFEPRPEWFIKRTTDGRVMCKVASSAGRNCIFAITMLSYCQYFKTNEQCVFCCIVPAVEHARDMGIDRILKPTVQRVLEVYKAVTSEHPVSHFNLTGGGLLDRKREANLYAEFLGQMLRHLSNDDRPWHVIPQALAEDDQKLLHDTGQGRITLCHPLEVWDEKLFPVIAPGKAKHVGREEWIAALVRAGKIFGPWQSTTTVVAGCETVPPHGFPTMDAAIKSMEEYLTYFLEHGVLPRFTFWTPAPGSPWETSQSPPTEYFLEISQLQHQLYRKHGVPLPRSTCRKCRVVSLESDLLHLRKETDDRRAASAH
ncbi:MAG: radical SAM protein [candidate division NC10 bacterium]